MNVLNQMNFLSKNYRPKCDICGNLCAIDFLIKKSNNNQINQTLLICSDCYNNEDYPKDLTKEDFDCANIFNIINPNESI